MGDSKLIGLLAPGRAPQACGSVREELASAPGALTRLRLRRHVGSCLGCGAFQDEVERQRRMFAVALPVVPTLGLKASALAAVGIGAGGGGAAGGGGLAALVGGKVGAKFATVALVASGAAVGGGVALVESPDRDSRSEQAQSPVAERPAQGGGGAGPLAVSPAADARAENDERERSAERRARADQRRQRRAAAKRRTLARQEATRRGHTERGREWAKTRGKGKKLGLFKQTAPTPPKAPARERSPGAVSKPPKLEKRERSLAPPRVKVPKAPKELRPPK